MITKGRKRCSVCNLEININDFEWHLKNGHNDCYVDDVNFEYYEGSDDSSDADFLQPNLDATRNYAHSYRETGSYGSHSSHDDYGDESES